MCPTKVSREEVKGYWKKLTDKQREQYKYFLDLAKTKTSDPSIAAGYAMEMMKRNEQIFRERRQLRASNSSREGGDGLHTGQLLLHNMQAVPWAKRTARFHAVIALAAPDGTLLGTADGVCEGMIATKPAGEGGFGYDPVFFLPDRGMTMAQVGTAVKRQISHRGQAMKAMEPLLRSILSPK